MAIHGGAWLRTGPVARRSIRPAAKRWVRRGFAVYSVDYSVGRGAVDDLEVALDAIVRERQPGRLCLYGESSGGHLALLLAAERREVECVIAVAAPVDLLSLGPDLAPISNFLFGPDPMELRRWSPAFRSRGIRASVLLKSGIDDPVVPVAQHRAFVKGRPGTKSFFLEPGERRWSHGSASASAIRQARRVEANFARRLTAGKNY